jgi:heme a synthase
MTPLPRFAGFTPHRPAPKVRLVRPMNRTRSLAGSAAPNCRTTDDNGRLVHRNMVIPFYCLIPTAIQSCRMIEHRFAKLAALATFTLLVIGGTVNPTGSSLACPEPTFVCNGELFPPMVGGVFYEHGHRLAAMSVGFLQIALTVLLFLRRPDLKKLGVALLGLVILQGALGAITVGYKLPWFVSTGHLLLGMSYFATLIYTIFKTRASATVPELQAHQHRIAELGSARRWIGIACVAVMGQLLLGALVRHHGAALVCLGVPSCTMSGDWFPAAGVQQLHMVHRFFGIVVGIVTVVAAVKVLQHSARWPALRRLAVVAPVLVIAQIVLGIATVMTMRSVPVAVGHFAGAAALWALWISAWFLTGLRRTHSKTSVIEMASAKVVTA